MVKKKVDERVQGLIEWGVKKNHRSLFVLVGDHGKDQVENLHKVLSRCRVKARPSVLWCYKKELGFSTHRKKRMKEIKRNQSRGLHDPDRDDPFDLFISSTTIRWTYYKDTDKVLGQTFGMCVLQDFEGLTPNLLARTVETVEGGGLVILLLKTVKSLKQLYTMSMDVHSRFRTEAHHEIIPRFNERFILSLAECQACLVLDDELNILPLSSKVNHIPAAGGENGTDLSGPPVCEELEELKASLLDGGDSHIAALVSLAKTIDQAHAVMSFLDAITEKTLRATVSLTAARGRGKSAAIGICLAGAIAYGYSNVFVTAPSPENLKTVFEFLISGLKALKFKDHMDFEVLQESRGEAGSVVTRVNVFRDHRQTVQYILPTEHAALAQAELVAIDEAAAIPLPVVQKLLGPYLVFMSSTVNGYEGTGRSLSLKLIQQLRQQQSQAIAASASSAGNSVAGSKVKKGQRKVHEDRWRVAAEAAANYSAVGGAARTLSEITLETPIRYGKGDAVEKWLNGLLCLDSATGSNRLVSVMPAPKDCELYLVDRDALFSYHSMAEGLLQRIWSLYTSAHYKNTPNDLQMLSDAPAHRLFVLLGPRKTQTAASGGPALPDVLCVVQIAFEGRISQQSVQAQMSRGNKASGDMIPWTVSQQFNDTEFATLSGARVVRVATHPDVQGMGYGSRALELLIEFFQGRLGGGLMEYGTFSREGEQDNDSDGDDSTDLRSERVTQKTKLPPLLVPLADRRAERLDWLGVSYGLTGQLLNFWSKKEFKICYLRQSVNELTGEHSAVMLRELTAGGGPSPGWLLGYVQDYRRRIVSLLSYSFRSLRTATAISLVDPDQVLTALNGSRDASIAGGSRGGYAASSQLTASELTSVHLSDHDLKRLELYSRNMVDHHMIMDMVPIISRLFFLGRFPTSCRLSHLQVAILLAVGLQHRDVDEISNELNLPANQVLAFFNKTIRKLSSVLREMLESEVSAEMASKSKVSQMAKRGEEMIVSGERGVSLKEDQETDEREFAQQAKKLLMQHKDIARHEIDADEEELTGALHRGMKKQGNAIPKSLSIPKKQSVSTSQEVSKDQDSELGKRKTSDKSAKKKKKSKKERA
mmetsp:Transcript_8866/g.13289  ORF Transcript_8866/g.13289 Transcript_8866/m.13289 type:complete len:1103 (+) Transcript_8866:133-3441(+)|eukprot:CAMPEP_0185035626 /NCGR_PEP_ID=MMETSP1103-20130426/27326_1 /TAXON_ID=36769 /ORGANISM="Paraphysomonas bandaiensis, Strain Caron Lab Isolate" /LENGTH=1102 /DNA_ID=CAMNT_0027572795 /DNA_START=25 /DNA_END=3333 /DNA_ORIENTATION=-